MKVGTVSKVMLGGNADVSTKSGIIIDADVILGQAEGRTKDLKGLVLSNKLIFGKSVSRAKMATVSGVAPLILADAISANVVELIAFGGTELVAETYIDTVTAEGKCEQVDPLDPTAVPTPTAPIDIVCNNGALKLSPNLVDFNETRINGSTWASADKTKGFEVEAAVYGKVVGNSVVGNANCFGVFVPCEQGESVSMDFFDYTPYGARCYYCEVDVDGKATTTPVQYATMQNVLTQQTFTMTQSNSIGFVIEWYITSTQERNYTKENYMVVRGSTPPTAYIPYGEIYTDGTVETVTDDVGNTATCEMLLGIGDYIDQQEIIGGTVTRKIGIKVLDGTENWTWNASSGWRARLNISTVETATSSMPALLCNMFAAASWSGVSATTPLISINSTGTTINFTVGWDANITTLSDWTTFLASQYTAGTPVIIVYPLATSTTETVTGQSLTKAPVTATGSLTGLVVTAVSSNHTTPNPYEPLDINCNNGVLKYGNVSKNLFDEVYPEPTTAIKYMHLYLGPGTYTCSYSMPVHSSNASMIYFLKGSVSSGANNGANQVDVDTPRTVTSTDGYVTIAYRTGGGFGLTGAVPSDYNCMVEQGSTATSYEPYRLDVYTDGTVETINVLGKNLFDGTITNFGFNVGGQTVSTNASYRSIVVKVDAGKTYTFSRQTAIGNRFTYYYTADVPALGVSGTGYSAATPVSALTTTFTVPAGQNYVVMYFDVNGTDISGSQMMVELGSTATTYEPYFNGGTATCEDLLSVGTYTDEQEVISGAVTRKVGIKVLDGTETWTQTTTNVVEAAIMTGQQYGETAMCSHLAYSSAGSFGAMADGSFKTGTATYRNKIYCKSSIYAADTTTWKQFLSAQYINGTPVIIVYPLETPTTETVTGQPMSTTQGTNIAEITQASMDGLELSVTYMAGVNATVEEIENAQLSPDVNVTIE